MALFNYKCSACGVTEEFLDQELPELDRFLGNVNCGHCEGGVMYKLASFGAVHFKGTGWPSKEIKFERNLKEKRPN